MDFSDIDWWLWLSTPAFTLLLFTLGAVRQGVNFRFARISSHKEKGFGELICNIFDGPRAFLSGPYSIKSVERFAIGIGLLLLSCAGTITIVLSLYFISLIFTYSFVWSIDALVVRDLAKEIRDESLIFFGIVNTFFLILFLISKDFARLKQERDARDLLMSQIFEILHEKSPTLNSVLTTEKIKEMLSRIEADVRTEAREVSNT